MPTIHNPVLPGFHPDPSMIRVDEGFLVATSTFEWFPGVTLHRSRDLVHFEQLPHPLSRVSQLDMIGVPDSGGVWAPALSQDPASGRLFLVYSIVREWTHHKDVRNFVVTADDPAGPWSEPVYLNTSGFDPSLFHDADGSKHLLNQRWDFRQDFSDDSNPFAGVVMQAYDPEARRLVGPVREIFAGSSLGCTEAPHLYRRDGWCYLLTAEGGTEYGHAVTVARSRSIEGPYELHPDNPLLTSKDDPGLALQKAGHASFADDADGRTWMAYLCGRPLTERGRCILGRETAVQEVRWDDDGWPRLVDGGASGRSPALSTPGPDVPAHPWPEPPHPAAEGFTGATLPLEFQTLRVPLGSDTLSLSERPGWLRLFGRESLASRFLQAHVARRVQHRSCEARTGVDFNPATFQQTAGLTAYYDTGRHFFFGVSHDERAGRCLVGTGMDNGRFVTWLDAPIPLPAPRVDGPVYLRARLDGADLRFAWSADGEAWEDAGPVLDASILSDEYEHLGFTGAFLGMACHDAAGTALPADFAFFAYEGRNGADGRAD